MKDNLFVHGLSPRKAICEDLFFLKDWKILKAK